jgi:hypothetical protein
VKRQGDLFHYYDPAIRDALFQESTDKMKPGELFRVRIFQQAKECYLEIRDVVAFMEKQKALFLGVRATTLFLESVKSIGMGKFYVSFDKKDLREKDKLPIVSRLDEGLTFRPDHFEGAWFGGLQLICFNRVRKVLARR